MDQSDRIKRAKMALRIAETERYAARAVLTRAQEALDKAQKNVERYLEALHEFVSDAEICDLVKTP